MTTGTQIRLVFDNTAIDAIGPSENGWIEIGGRRIYSCYWSPNLPTHTFEDFLDRLEASDWGSRVPVVIAGDFNAKSHEWGSSIKDDKSASFADLVASMDFMVSTTT